MSSNYQQKKMMNALGTIDTKGNIVLEQFQDGTALLEKYNGKLPTMVNFIFDEFANIGTIPDIEQTIAVTPHAVRNNGTG